MSPQTTDITLLIYSETPGELLVPGRAAFPRTSRVWPTILVADLAEATELQCAIDALLREEAELCARADQGVVLVPEQGDQLAEEEAAKRAVARSFAESRQWTTDARAPWVTDTWEGEHAWAFFLSSGSMDTHGAVVDKHTGRVFLRYFASFNMEFFD
ncbi:MAG: hypothetical protein QM778_21160 [Myxococcales bacterium]